MLCVFNLFLCFINSRAAICRLLTLNQCYFFLIFGLSLMMVHRRPKLVGDDDDDDDDNNNNNNNNMQKQYTKIVYNCILPNSVTMFRLFIG